MAAVLVATFFALAACHASQPRVIPGPRPIIDWQLRPVPLAPETRHPTEVGWRTVASADTMARGTVTISAAALSALARRAEEYASLELTISEVLKGTAPAALTLLFYPANEYGPSADRIISLNGADVIAGFGQRSGSHYLLHGAEDVLVPATDELARAVHAEVEGQASLASQVAARLAASQVPLRDGVEQLIDRVLTDEWYGWPIYLSPQPDGSLDFEMYRGTDPEDYPDAKIMTLNRAAVPALVALMDDRRALKVESVSIWNTSPDAFEALSHYQPATVVDFVSMVLEQLTEESPGFLNNGGTEAERQQVIQAWRVWLGKSLGLSGLQRPS